MFSFAKSAAMECVCRGDSGGRCPLRTPTFLTAVLEVYELAQGLAWDRCSGAVTVATDTGPTGAESRRLVVIQAKG